MKTKLFNTFAAASAALLTFLGAASVRAGTITVVGLPAVNTDIATGITTNKSYVCAFDYGSKDAVTYSVNGVPFAHVTVSANNTFLVANFVDPNHSSDQVIVSVSANNHGINVTSSTPSGQADGNMNNLFFDQIFPGNGQPANGWMQEEYDNLTIGHPYSLRIYYRYQGGGTGQRLMNVYFNGEGTPQAYSGNPLQLDTGAKGVLPNGLICQGANYIEYDFTAAATNVFCLITNINGGEGSTTFAATVEDTSVPYGPFITYQPSAAITGPATFAFNVQAIGTAPLAYQWYVNTVSNYIGATMTTDGSGYTGSTTNILTTTINYLDYYFVVISNNLGSVTSSIVQINPSPVIIAQPSPSEVGNGIVFNMTAGGVPPLTYQWYNNTVSNTTGATMLTDGNGYSGSTTNILTTTTNLLDFYFVVVSNNFNSVTSKVVAVASPLMVVSAGEPIWNQAGQSNIIVTFSDLVDPTTATTATNYSLNNSASVLSAALVGSKEVVLTTSALTTSYTLTVSHVKDLFGIAMVPASTNLAVGSYPAKLALWVRADTGVTTDADGVNQWNDLSGNGNNFVQGNGPPYEPQLGTNAYGDTVITFNATNLTFMEANSTPTLAITGDISIIAVVNFTALIGTTNGEIVSKTGVTPMANVPASYDFYVASPGNGGRLYRGDGTNYGQFSGSTLPSVGIPHIFTVTETGNTVSHFLDGVAIGTGILNNNFVETGCVDAGQPLSIGIRADEFNTFTGDMSELIIAASPITSYDVAALDNYLITRHNLPIFIVNPNATNIVYSLTGNQLTFSWPADHTGWQLQSNSVGLAFPNDWFTVAGSTTTNQITITTDVTLTNVFYRLFLP
jgi:hypothetical protein